MVKNRLKMGKISKEIYFFIFFIFKFLNLTEHEKIFKFRGLILSYDKMRKQETQSNIFTETKSTSDPCNIFVRNSVHISVPLVLYF